MRSPVVVLASLALGTLPALDQPLSTRTDGAITHWLHLGSTQASHLRGTPASGQSTLFDLLLQAGEGEEWRQRPSAGDSVAFPAILAADESPMVWTALDDADGTWFDAGGAAFIDYAACYVIAPDDRTARLAWSADDDLAVWLDGVETPLIFNETGQPDHGPFTLTTGPHVLVVKLLQVTGASSLRIAFQHVDGSPMTDLLTRDVDPIAPRILAMTPADGDGDVSVNAFIDIAFDEPMDRAAGAMLAVAVDGGAAVSGHETWSDARHLAWTPDQPLTSATTYAVSSTAACHDRAGNPPAFPTARFTTAVTASSPTIVSARARRRRSTFGVPMQLEVDIAGTGFLADGVRCPPGTSGYVGTTHRYRLERAPGANFEAADAAAREAYGHLATIGDASEDDAVWRLGGRANGWIGLAAPARANTPFAWVTGEPLAYANWYPGEPNNSDGSENRGIYWWGLRWNDVGSVALTQRPYVVEYDAAAGPSVWLHSGGTTLGLGRGSFASATAIAAWFGAPLAGVDTYDVSIESRDGAIATLAGGLSLVNHAPTLADAAIASDPGHVWRATLAGADAEGDDLTYAVVAGPAHGTLALDPFTGAFTCTPAAAPVADAFTVTVSDGALTSAPATISLIPWDPSPTIAVSAPPPTATAAATVGIAGTAASAAGIVEVDWHLNFTQRLGSWTANGVAVGTTAWSIAALPLTQEGVATVELVALAADGHVATTVLTIVVDRTPPTIAIASPRAGAHVIAGRRIVVAGTATDAHLSTLTWTLSGATTGTNAVSATPTFSLALPPLAAGATTIAVTATDVAGHAASAAITVTATPPEHTVDLTGVDAPSDAGARCGAGAVTAAALALSLLLARRRLR